MKLSLFRVYVRDDSTIFGRALCGLPTYLLTYLLTYYDKSNNTKSAVNDAVMKYDEMEVSK